MNREVRAAGTEAVDPAHAVTYVMTPPADGDLETGAVLLDGRLIGQLRRRRREGRTLMHPFGTAGPESVWHAEAVGWLPNIDRPWDARITRTAPTRRRAAEDLLRAYARPR